jgi:hypothetical protein
LIDTTIQCNSTYGAVRCLLDNPSVSGNESE